MTSHQYFNTLASCLLILGKKKADIPYISQAQGQKLMPGQTIQIQMGPTNDFCREIRKYRYFLIEKSALSRAMQSES